ncbi:MAG: peptidoglycan binding domain-containing protein [Candidatus Limnocylindrales bacterium]
MTTDTPDPFGTKEQSKASVRPTPLQAPVADVPTVLSSELRDDRPSSEPPERPRSRVSPPSVAPRHLRLAGFAVAFVFGAVAAFLFLSAVAFGFAGSYSDRVLPGVRAGSVDLSGMTRDQAIARLQSAYAYLAQGEVTVTTPVGVATITYQQAGRAPDVEVMADAALAVGHSGNPLADAASVVHSAAFGQQIPVVVQVDPTAVAERIRQLVGTSSIAPQNAQATAKGGTFSFTPATAGHGIDEQSIGAAIINQLAEANAPADLQAGGTFTTLKPQVTD